MLFAFRCDRDAMVFQHRAVRQDREECADVAQLVEHHLAKVRVARFPDTEEVTGSIPVSPTTQC